jgi:hypothetical protein
MGYGNLPHHFLLYVFAAVHLPVLLYQENDWFGGALNWWLRGGFWAA